MKWNINYKLKIFTGPRCCRSIIRWHRPYGDRHETGEGSARNLRRYWWYVFCSTSVEDFTSGPLIRSFSAGLDTQIQEIKESVELPLTHPEYYEEMGIKPPKGVILYGPPGTGKTLLAKAVANQTSATFLRVVGSELIQKYLVNIHFLCAEYRNFTFFWNRSFQIFKHCVVFHKKKKKTNIHFSRS